MDNDFGSEFMPNPSQSFPKRRSHQSQPALYPISSPPEYPNARVVLQFLKQSRITETPLSVEHVESLLNVLVLDGEIERVSRSSIAVYLLLSLVTRFLRMVPLSGIPRQSRTMQNLNLSVVPKANENTDPARVVVVIRKARAQNGRTAIWNWMTHLPHRERRRAVGQNAKTAILTANQNENDESLKLATAIVTKARRKSRRTNGRSGLRRKNRKAESNLRMSPLPPRPTRVRNPMDLPDVNGPEVFPPSRDRSQTPRNSPNDLLPLHRSRNTITKA